MVLVLIAGWTGLPRLFFGLIPLLKPGVECSGRHQRLQDYLFDILLLIKHSENKCLKIGTVAGLFLDELSQQVGFVNSFTHEESLFDLNHD